MKKPCFNTTLLESQAVLGVENLLERLNLQLDLLTELESHWSLISPLTQQQLGLMHGLWATFRSEEHTSELQSPVPISYAVFCLKKKKQQ